MDHAPISTRRVLAAFVCTAFVALLPVLFLAIDSGVVPFAADPDTRAGYGGLVLMAGSVMGTAVLIGMCMLAVALGRRVVRRPYRA